MCAIAWPILPSWRGPGETWGDLRGPEGPCIVGPAGLGYPAFFDPARRGPEGDPAGPWGCPGEALGINRGFRAPIPW